MDGQPPETRLKLLETSVSQLDERVTNHGHELDQLKESLIRAEEHNHYRDEQFATFGTKLDRMDGKISVMASQKNSESAEKWDKAVWLIIGGVIMAAVNYMLRNIGL